MTFMGFVLALCAVASGIGVIGFRNPLFSAFSLVANLMTMAGLYALLDAHFLAVSQVVVYAGAIMVLVLFVLMLLNLKVESGPKLGLMRAGLALTGGVVILVTGLKPIMAHFDTVSAIALRENAARTIGDVASIGEQLFGRYVVQFELSSLVLLIGIVGAVMLAKRKNVQLAPRNGLGEAK
jgi:NADH-quinone oxidoreductase subunit J